MPCRRQCSSSATQSARGMVQPVGLFGALTSTMRVPGVAASSRRCRSSDQRPSWHASGTRTTSALMMRGIAVRFGQTGVTIATRSPGSISVWSISDSACTPALVTAIAVDRDGLRRSVQPVRVRRQCRAQLLDPEVVVVEGLPGVERRLGRLADEGGRDLVAFAEPELQDVGAADAGVGHLADAGGGQGLDQGSDHGRDYAGAARGRWPRVAFVIESGARPLRSPTH